jgi:UDP-N-acetylmuramate dehydrogenase
MAQYTTFRVGGPAEALYRVRTLEELCRVVTFLNTETIPYLVLGRGSNLLIKDEGLSGVVIRFGRFHSSVEFERKGEDTVLAGAGLRLSSLLTACRRKGLTGLEFLAGIPGTVGGAVAMNAGAFGSEIKTRVIDVNFVTPQGEQVVKSRRQLEFLYRKLMIEKDWLIVQARFCLEPGSREKISLSLADHLKRRKTTQPLEYPSAGSVFKNPPDDYAGRLIEAVGLKGKRIGGAMISPKHANYIVNLGSAKASDILSLLDLARQMVKAQMGIELEPEIRIMGR